MSSVTRNTKNVPYYILGCGAFSHLDALVNARREMAPGPALFYVDHFFQNRELSRTLPVAPGDHVFYVNTTGEPTVEMVDALADMARARLDGGQPCCLVGIGGGAVLDTTKAVGNLLTNPGKAADYQGWELVKNPAPYKIAVPTLSGTGAEVSRTCVLLNAARRLKLGMNSDHTVYDQLVLDPDLTTTVPRDQFFYTGLDTYMHCFESIQGRYRNIIVDNLSATAIAMSREVFLSENMQSPENREKMMVASYLGGMAAGNTGLVHPFSAGLSVELHLPHGLANCLALSVLGEFYPEEYAQFTEMRERQKIVLPSRVCADLPDNRLEGLYMGTIVHEKPLSNALGDDFKAILTRDKVLSLFKQI